MGFLRSSAPILLLVIFFILVILAVWLAFLNAGLRRHQGRHKEISNALDKANLAEALSKALDDVEDLRKELGKLAGVQQSTRKQLEGSFQRLGIVRFNAFDDLGGELSFAAALLNEHGDGMLISSIYGREESRSYVKPVKKGKSSFALSAEEEEALTKAANARDSVEIKSAKEISFT